MTTLPTDLLAADPSINTRLRDFLRRQSLGEPVRGSDRWHELRSKHAGSHPELEVTTEEGEAF